MKILVIQLRRIGDILLTTSVLRYLKESVGPCEVDFLCEPCGRDILATHPHLREVLIYDKNRPLHEISRIRKKSYDVIIDFMNNPRTSVLVGFSGAKQTVSFRRGIRSLFYNMTFPTPQVPEYVPLRKIRLVKSWLEASGKSALNPAGFLPELFLVEEEKAFAANWMKSENLQGNDFVVLVPAHRHPIRQWRSEGFREVGLRLAQESIKVFLAWGPGEEKIIEEVQRGDQDILKKLPPTSLRQMAAIFKQSRLVVTNDSGAMHLAVSVGTPTVTIYGPTRPIDWNPSLSGSDAPHRFVTASGVDCLGCHLLECPVGHICMKRLDSEEVFKNALQLLSGEKSNV